jgi:hypothetical protein
MATKYTCDECGKECSPCRSSRAFTFPVSRGRVSAVVKPRLHPSARNKRGHIDICQECFAAGLQALAKTLLAELQDPAEQPRQTILDVTDKLLEDFQDPAEYIYPEELF